MPSSSPRSRPRCSRSWRRWDGAGVGVALIRDGNGPRSLETIMRYRNAAMAEFMRALRTLKALQAEQAAGAEVLEMPQSRPNAPARRASPLATPNEPEPVMAYVLPEPPAGRARHEPAAAAPAPEANEPESRAEPPAERPLAYILPDPPAPGTLLHEAAAPSTPNEPEPWGDLGRGDPQIRVGAPSMDG